MGRGGQGQFETALQELDARNRQAIGVRIGFEEREARQRYAGSDFLPMPSRFEPCGLSQMYAQRFGSLPVAHRTGGLADTIQDGVTGLLFSELSMSGLIDGITRVFESFGAKRRLAVMRRTAMSRSFGWHRSAIRYGNVYGTLLANRRNRVEAELA